MNIFISNGVFLTTRTILHVRNWAPNFFLNFDRIMCLIIFFCYSYDLIELLVTSIYVEYKSEELGEEDTGAIETAKSVVKHYGKSAFKDPVLRKKIYDKLPAQVPLKIFSRDQASALGYTET